MGNETATTLASIQSTRSASSLSFSPSFVSTLIGVCDAVVIFGTGVAVFALYLGWHHDNFSFYLTPILISAALILTAFYFAGLYKIPAIKDPRQQWIKILAISVFVFFSLLGLAFALKISDQISRVWAFSSWIIGISLICVVRIFALYLIRHWAKSGYLTRNIVILGVSEQGRRFIAELKRINEPWNVVVGIFDDRSTRLKEGFSKQSVCGSVEALCAFVRQNRVDEVVLALPWSAENRILELLDRLRELPVQVCLAPDLVGFRFSCSRFSRLGGIGLLDIAHKPLEGWKVIVKELEDKILALLLLILFAPLMLLIALGIKLESRGPMIFRQPRYGYNNKVFSVLKFRTMYHKHAPEKDVPQARRNDPRVTRIGRFLRRLSLDELPQLFNVLQGTMSLVGPRPQAVPHNEEYAAIISGYFARHRMKPGITGWAQVNGLRGETDAPEKMKARVEHDIYYTDHWSLLFDLQILIMTALVVLSQKNAH